MSDSPASVLHNTSGTEVGTNANPLRTDPTGSTTQPVSDGGGSLTIDGTVAVSGSVAVTGPLTDTELRATAVPVSGPLTDTQLRASAVPVTGPLTDTQLRATAVPTSNAASSQVDGHSVSIGATSDADTALTVIGRLKKLVALIAGGLPAALVGGRLDSNTGSWLGSTAPTVGQKTMANSIPINVASDQSSIPTTLSTGDNVVGKVKLVDADALALDVEFNTSVPANTRGLIMVGEDANGMAQQVQVNVDSVDSSRRLQIEGKVSITAPQPPPSTTPVTIDAGSPLVITGTQTANYTITNGKRFMIQQVVAGCEGDTSERGSCVEVFYFDGTTEHIIERVYLNGFTTETYPAASKSRDGTTLDGNGTTKTIRITRRRLSGSSQEVDATVRGYEFTP